VVGRGPVRGCALQLKIAFAVGPSRGPGSGWSAPIAVRHLKPAATAASPGTSALVRAAPARRVLREVTDDGREGPHRRGAWSAPTYDESQVIPWGSFSFDVFAIEGRPHRHLFSYRGVDHGNSRSPFVAALVRRHPSSAHGRAEPYGSWPQAPRGRLLRSGFSAGYRKTRTRMNFILPFVDRVPSPSSTWRVSGGGLQGLRYFHLGQLVVSIYTVACFFQVHAPPAPTTRSVNSIRHRSRSPPTNAAQRDREYGHLDKTLTLPDPVNMRLRRGLPRTTASQWGSGFLPG